EDGIRDFHVTGVQTCALPILDGDLYNDDTDNDGFTNHSDPDDDGDGTPTRLEIIINEDGTIEMPDTNGDGTPNYLDPDYFEEVRSEERRVGKEGRNGWSSRQQ